jgi:catechol 2,3-dioxygenase-like lactoylglutathione lyase family enzyme
MTVIPELRTADPDRARDFLCGVFGFQEVQAGLVVLGDQQIALAPGEPAGHGPIDHLAIAVPDLEEAVARALRRGGRLDPEITASGPGEIPEFWGGVRYRFLAGPEGARIELIQRQSGAFGPGHDHLGLPTSDADAMSAFLAGFGAVPMAAHRLVRPEGVTDVRFLQLGSSVLEVYRPPGELLPRPPGFWSRLLIPGAPEAKGPGGVLVGPAQGLA